MLGRIQKKHQVFHILLVLFIWDGSAVAQEIDLIPVAPNTEVTRSVEIDQARQLVEDNDLMRAFALLADIMERHEDEPEIYQHAEFEMGKVLLMLDLPLAASYTFGDIAEAGEGHLHYFETIDWFLRIQEKVIGDPESLLRLAEYDPLLYPPSEANSLRFLVGQYHYGADDLESAIDSLTSVEQDAELPYLRSQFLLGVIHSREERFSEGLEAFKNILRYQRDVRNNNTVRDMAQRATLAMARLFYTVGDFEKAIRYYDRIEQEDEFWLESLFEISWSFFRRNNHERALGNLLTLNSPYFIDSYHPEALILQAVILHTNCHFRDSLAAVAGFVDSYKPLKEELEIQLKQTSDPNAFYRYLAQLSRQEQTAELSLQLKRVVNAALADTRLRRLLSHIVHMDQEAMTLEELLKTSDSDAAKDVITSTLTILISNRDLVVAKAGQAAMTRIRRVYDELNNLLSQALRIKYETLRAQRTMLKAESSMSVEAVAAAQSVELPPPSTDDEHMYWPFEGEYWRDELGAYTFLISNRCLNQIKRGSTP